MALTSGLISYWKLDETSGNAADSVATNTGTATAITWQAGKINNGASFNGSTSVINCGTDSSLNPTAISISCWAKFTSFTPSYTHIVGREHATGTPYCVFLVKSTGKLACYTYTTADVSYDGTGSNTLSTGTWYHLVMTYDSTNGLIGYVNGSSDGSAAANGNLNSYAGTFSMGNGTANTSRQITGMIDEVGVWNRALTSTEISQLYNAGSGLQYPFTASKKLLLLGVG